MSVTIRETKDSRAFDLNAKDGSSTFKYLVSVTGETNPENAIYTTLLTGETYAPYQWNGLSRGLPSATPLGNGWYDVSLPYRRPDGARTSDPGATTPAGGQPPNPPPPPAQSGDLIDNGTSLEIGGKPPRLFKSRKTLIRTAPVGVAPDFEGLINVGQDGKADGVEIPDPAVVLTVTRQFDYMTWGYVDRVYDCCFRTNAAALFARAAGQLMLTGASFRVEKGAKVSVTYKFGVDKGETDIPIGTTAAGAAVTVDRGPWEYLWFAYKDDKKAGDTRLSLTVIGAYVEQLVTSADYSVLGLG